MYNIIYETSHQSRFDARYWMLGVVHWDDPEGGYREGGGRREEVTKRASKSHKINHSSKMGQIVIL